MRRGPLLIPLVLLVMVLGACAARTGSGGGADAPDPTGTTAPATSSPASTSPASTSPASTSPASTSPASTSPVPTSAATALPGPVTVVRSGGIAGLRDTVVVQPGGAWQRTAAVGRGKDSTGMLAAGQLAELTALATDPALVRESGHTAISTVCADAFGYLVRVGATSVAFVDCPNDPEQPVIANRIARLLLTASGG